MQHSTSHTHHSLQRMAPTYCNYFLKIKVSRHKLMCIWQCEDYKYKFLALVLLILIDIALYKLNPALGCILIHRVSHDVGNKGIPTNSNNPPPPHPHQLKSPPPPPLTQIAPPPPPNSNRTTTTTNSNPPPSPTTNSNPPIPHQVNTVSG